MAKSNDPASARPASVPDARTAVRALLYPRSIAIIGASPDRVRLNGRPMHFMLRDGYGGKLYPVNPKYTDISGIPCYPDIKSLPEAPDMAIVAVAAARASETIIELGRKGVRAAILFSSGFGEMGEAGKKLERDLVATAHAHGVRICGPNTLGLISAFDKVIATFSQYADQPPIAGPVGFASQSGAFGTGISALARTRGLGMGYFVSTGNTADLTPTECLEEMLEDDRIRVIAGYIEGLSDGPGLMRLAGKSIEKRKPLVLVKVGRQAAGARAAASHTGQLAGEDRVFDAVARQAGILRCRNEEHMLDTVSALVSNPIAEGRGLAIITQSGGAGVLMADRAEEIGLEVPAPGPEAREKLKAVLPEYGATGNPIDVTAQFLAEPKILTESVRLALDDPNMHVCIIWLQLMHSNAPKLVELFREIKRTVKKPIVICWVEAPPEARNTLVQEGICVVSATERAVDAAASLVAWGEVVRRLGAPGVAGAARLAPPPGGEGVGGLQNAGHRDSPPPQPSPTRGDGASASGKSGEGVVAGAKGVPSMEALAILKTAGIPTVESRLAKSPADAAKVAAELGFPVAIKIESVDLPHKTEAGGVILGVKSAEEASAAAEKVLASARAYDAKARVDGVLVQKMAAPSTEIVLGLRRDPIFGPVVMVGLGGIFVEVLKDVAFAAALVSEDWAHEMLNSLKGSAILDGARGKPAADRNALAKAIVALGRLALAHPEIEELDLNPVFAGPQGVVAVDWLMMRRAAA